MTSLDQVLHLSIEGGKTNAMLLLLILQWALVPKIQGLAEQPMLGKPLINEKEMRWRNYSKKSVVILVSVSSTYIYRHFVQAFPFSNLPHPVFGRGGRV
jgi:hypothetical protein